MQKDFSEKQRKLEVYKKTLKQNPTKSELVMIEKLNEIGYRAMFQKGFIAGKNFCIADFYLPSHKLVIEVDGVYHTTDEQKKRDANKDYYYSTRGFKVLRITDEQAMSISIYDLKKLIDSYKKSK